MDRVEHQNQQITLEYYRLSEEVLKAEVLASAADHERVRQHKRRIVAELTGQPVKENQTPLEAWILWLCHINGLPEELPAPPEIAEAIMWNEGARKFMWFIA